MGITLLKTRINQKKCATLCCHLLSKNKTNHQNSYTIWLESNLLVEDDLLQGNRLLPAMQIENVRGKTWSNHCENDLAILRRLLLFNTVVPPMMIEWKNGDKFCGKGVWGWLEGGQKHVRLANISKYSVPFVKYMEIFSFVEFFLIFLPSASRFRVIWVGLPFFFYQTVRCFTKRCVRTRTLPNGQWKKKIYQM